MVVAAGSGADGEVGDDAEPHRPQPANRTELLVHERCTQAWNATSSASSCASAATAAPSGSRNSAGQRRQSPPCRRAITVNTANRSTRGAAPIDVAEEEPQRRLLDPEHRVAIDQRQLRQRPALVRERLERGVLAGVQSASTSGTISTARWSGLRARRDDA